MLPIFSSVVTQKSISQVKLLLQIYTEFFIALHEKQKYRHRYADARDNVRPYHRKLLKDKTVDNEFRADAEKA